MKFTTKISSIIKETYYHIGDDDDENSEFSIQKTSVDNNKRKRNVIKKKIGRKNRKRLLNM
jgi:hypothetical protein